MQGCIVKLMTAKPSRRREQTRARLLDAAYEVFGEVGMDAASVETICERAGFTRGAFYSNFESKEELFIALITRLAEEKLDEVASRVGSLEAGDMTEPAALVRRIVGVSVADKMDPQLLSEIRTQALRDPRVATAYLAWQRGMRDRVEGIVRKVVEVYGIRLRLPVEETAQLVLDMSDDTCTLAAIEGRSAEETGVLLNARLERLVTALVD